MVGGGEGVSDIKGPSGSRFSLSEPARTLICSTRSALRLVPCRILKREAHLFSDGGELPVLLRNRSLQWSLIVFGILTSTLAVLHIN